MLAFRHIHRVGQQKRAYRCKFANHRVYSCMIMCQCIFFFIQIIVNLLVPNLECFPQVRISTTMKTHVCMLPLHTPRSRLHGQCLLTTLKYLLQLISFIFFLRVWCLEHHHEGRRDNQRIVHLLLKQESYLTQRRQGLQPTQQVTFYHKDIHPAGKENSSQWAPGI